MTKQHTASALALTALGFIAYGAGVALGAIALALIGAGAAVLGSAWAMTCISTEEEET